MRVRSPVAVGVSPKPVYPRPMGSPGSVSRKKPDSEPTGGPPRPLRARRRPSGAKSSTISRVAWLVDRYDGVNVAVTEQLDPTATDRPEHPSETMSKSSGLVPPSVALLTARAAEPLLATVMVTGSLVVPSGVVGKVTGDGVIWRARQAPCDR